MLKMQTKQQSILPLFLVVLSQTFGFRSVISCREHTSVKYLLIRLFICLLADHSHFDRTDKLICSVLFFHMLLHQPENTTPTSQMLCLGLHHSCTLIFHPAPSFLRLAKPISRNAQDV